VTLPPIENLHPTPSGKVSCVSLGIEKLQEDMDKFYTYLNTKINLTDYNDGH
jgi:hypothetical protein